MQERLIVQNNFHETSVVVVAEDGLVTKRQAARARKELCGIKHCNCGGELGERGPQTTASGQRISFGPICNADGVTGYKYQLV